MAIPSGGSDENLGTCRIKIALYTESVIQEMEPKLADPELHTEGSLCVVAGQFADSGSSEMLTETDQLSELPSEISEMDAPQRSHSSSVSHAEEITQAKHKVKRHSRNRSLDFSVPVTKTEKPRHRKTASMSGPLPGGQPPSLPGGHRKSVSHGSDLIEKMQHDNDRLGNKNARLEESLQRCRAERDDFRGQLEDLNDMLQERDEELRGIKNQVRIMKQKMQKECCEDEFNDEQMETIREYHDELQMLRDQNTALKAYMETVAVHDKAHSSGDMLQPAQDARISDMEDEIKSLSADLI